MLLNIRTKITISISCIILTILFFISCDTNDKIRPNQANRTSTMVPERPALKYQIIRKSGWIPGTDEGPHRITIYISPIHKNVEDIRNICEDLIKRNISDQANYFFLDDMEAAQIQADLIDQFRIHDVDSIKYQRLSVRVASKYYPHMIGHYYYLGIAYRNLNAQFYPYGLNKYGEPNKQIVEIEIPQHP